MSARSNSPDPKRAAASPRARRAVGSDHDEATNANAMSLKWTALHEAAAVVSNLAEMPPEYRTPDIRNFPIIMRDTGGWRYVLARQGVGDLAAMMEPGIAALLAVQTQGGPTLAAARALWQEFKSARGALLDLVPPLGNERRR